MVSALRPRRSVRRVLRASTQPGGRVEQARRHFIESDLGNTQAALGTLVAGAATVTQQQAGAGIDPQCAGGGAIGAVRVVIAPAGSEAAQDELAGCG